MSAADHATSGMIALLPTAADAARLAVADDSNAESADALHLTLVYLGDDVTEWPEGAGDDLAELLYAAAPSFDRVAAHILGPAEFNPSGGPDGDREPCAVYLIGDAPDLAPLRAWLLATLAAGDGYQTPPPQHEPYFPHVTAGFGLPAAALTADGPITFDRLRLALGDVVLDVHLGADTVDVDVDDDGAIELKWLPRVELKVASPDPRAVRLRRYWSRGPGRAKWDTFRELRRHLGKYVKRKEVLNGLTANIYRQAKGHWPGRRGGIERKGLDEAWTTPDIEERTMHDGVDEWGGIFAESGLDLDALADDGELAPDEAPISPAELAEASALASGADGSVEMKGVTDAALRSVLDDFARLSALDDTVTDEPGARGPDMESWEQIVADDVALDALPGGELRPRDRRRAPGVTTTATPADITTLGSIKPGAGPIDL